MLEPETRCSGFQIGCSGKEGRKMREHMLIAHTLIRADLLCRVLLIGYPKS